MTNVPNAGSDATPTRPTWQLSSPARTENARYFAGLLARAAAELGSSHALTAGQPGSWKAKLVPPFRLKAPSAGATSISPTTEDCRGERIVRPGAPRLALSRSEAAATLGMALRHFQRRVQPHLRCIYSGQLRALSSRGARAPDTPQSSRNGTAA